MNGMGSRLFPNWQVLAGTIVGAMLVAVALLFPAIDGPQLRDGALICVFFVRTLVGGALGWAIGRAITITTLELSKLPATDHSDSAELSEPVALLTAILQTADESRRSPGWLLPFRWRLREIIQQRPVKALDLLAADARDPALRRLAVWLSGRCRGTYGTKTLAELRIGAPVNLRKEITRALKHKGAWAVLREIELTDPDPRIRLLARQRAPTPLNSRMKQFLRHTSAHPVSLPRQPLFIDARIDPRAGKPPKAPSLIRRILEHIRALVHGPA